jgi:hypothetical protein
MLSQLVSAISRQPWQPFLNPNVILKTLFEVAHLIRSRASALFQEQHRAFHPGASGREGGLRQGDYGDDARSSISSRTYCRLELVRMLSGMTMAR